MTDQTVGLLIGLGGGVVTLLSTTVPLLFKFLSTQQEIKKELMLAKTAASTAAEVAVRTRDSQERHAERVDEALTSSKEALATNTEMTKAALEKIDVANNINDKLLATQHNIARLQEQAINNRASITELESLTNTKPLS